MSRWTPRVAAALVLAAVLAGAVPSGHAAPLRVSDALPFDGEVDVPTSAAELRRGAFLVSGSLDFSSSLHGVLLALETHPDTRIDAARLRVFDPLDPLSLHNDAPLFDLQNATLIPDEGASLLWSAPNGTVHGDIPYTFSFLFALERALPDLADYGPNRRDDAPPALVSAADRHAWRVTTPDERSRMFPFGGGFRVQADGIDQPFEEGDWLVEVYRANATVRSQGFAAPLEPDASVTFRAASADAFSAGFSVDGLSAFLKTAEGLATGFKVPKVDAPEGFPDCSEPDACPPPDPQPAAPPPHRSLPFLQPGNDNGTSADNRTDDNHTQDNTPDNTTGNGTGNETTPPPAAGPLDAYAEMLERLGPVLNGALFGTLDADLRVGHANETDPGFTLLRFTEMQIAPLGTDTVQVIGDSQLAFTGGSVVHDENVIPIGPFLLTPLAMGLYVIAIGLVLASRVLKPREPDAALEERLRPFALITGIAGVAGALILFDREVHYLLGQSFLGTIGLWGNGATAAFAVIGAAPSLALLLVEVLLWAAVAALYAVPLTLIGVTLLRLGGLRKPVRGFAAGVAAILTWALGAPLVRPLLDGVMGLILGA